MHLQPVFAAAEMHGVMVSEMFFEQELCLPSGSAMKEEERERVIKAVKTGFGS